jgi:hypothetical protein
LMTRWAVLLAWGAGCWSSDGRRLAVEGPDVIVVEHLGPVEGPSVALSDGSAPEGLSVHVTPSEVAVVTEGQVVAVGPGEAEVEVHWREQRATWRLRVAPRLTLRIVRPPAELRVGQREPLHLEASVDGRPTDPGAVQWLARPEGIARVTEAGEVEAVSPGVVYVSATQGATEAMVQITVVQ